MAQAAKLTIREAIDDDVDEAIRLCGGDARLAVRKLILGQQAIEREAAERVSAGYIRRGLR